MYLILKKPALPAGFFLPFARHTILIYSSISSSSLQKKESSKFCIVMLLSIFKKIIQN